MVRFSVIGANLSRKMFGGDLFPEHRFSVWWQIVLLRFQNVSCWSVSVGFAEKTSVFGSV